MKRNTGIGIAQVIVALGLLGGLSAVFMQISGNMSKSQRSVRISSDILQMNNQINKQLLSNTSCLNTVSPIGIVDITKDYIDFNSIKNSRDLPIVTTTATGYANNSFRIGYIRLYGSYDQATRKYDSFAGSIIPNPIVSTGQGDLTIEVQFLKTAKKIFGGKQIVKRFPIIAVLDSSYRITKCFSALDNAVETARKESCESIGGILTLTNNVYVCVLNTLTMNSTNGVRIGTRDASNNFTSKVVVTNGGKVKIGASAVPSLHLEVNGEIKTGNTGAPCNAANQGATRYNATTHVMEFCKGGVTPSWTSMTGGGGAPCDWVGTINTAMGNDCAGDTGTIITCTSGVITSVVRRFHGASSRCSCFAAGTQVLLADGTYKNIEEIRIGEKLMGKNGINTVLDLDLPIMEPDEDQKLISINGSDYFITDNHPVMTIGGWKALRPENAESEAYDILHNNLTKLAVGDVIIGANGGYIFVYSISIAQYVRPIKLYNFVLDGDSTYFANDMLVLGFLPDLGGKFHIEREHVIE